MSDGLVFVQNVISKVHLSQAVIKSKRSSFSHQISLKLHENCNDLSFALL